ncbi:MFS transporter [Novosphingobium sp. 9]|uniref:MFS transporter n=1 Tax=Novosphingobium sp. 9 TaxID=2025349 RepID=UPI0021B4DCB6|nr:MFS transporter [Novosphingobium sp. 9]
MTTAIPTPLPDAEAQSPRTASLLSPAHRRFLFALALTAGILNLVDRQIIAVLKPTIAADLHWSDDDYGTLAAWFQGAAAFGFLGAGWLVDRLGLRRANALGVTVWSLAAMAHGWASGFREFIACRIALGASEAMGTPAGIKTVALIFPPEKRTTGFGLFNAINSLGAILTPLGIPLAAALWGWRSTFVIAGGIGLVWGLVWMLGTRGVSFGDTRKATGNTQPISGILRERRTWTVALAKVLSDATWWLMLFWMPDYFNRAFGLSGVALGVPLAIAYLGSATGSLVSGYVSSHLLAKGWSVNRTRKTVMLISALCVLPVPLALHASSYGIAVGLMALTLAGHQGFSTSLFALIADVTPATKVGRVTGFGSFCGNLGGMAISKIAGLVLAAGLGYAPLFGFAAVSYLLALGWIQLMMPRIRLAED